jgi:cysteine-rich repeat protein
LLCWTFVIGRVFAVILLVALLTPAPGWAWLYREHSEGDWGTASGLVLSSQRDVIVTGRRFLDDHAEGVQLALDSAGKPRWRRLGFLCQELVGLNPAGDALLVSGSAGHCARSGALALLDVSTGAMLGEAIDDGEVLGQDQAGDVVVLHDTLLEKVALDGSSRGWSVPIARSVAATLTPEGDVLVLEPSRITRHRGSDGTVVFEQSIPRSLGGNPWDGSVVAGPGGVVVVVDESGYVPGWDDPYRHWRVIALEPETGAVRWVHDVGLGDAHYLEGRTLNGVRMLPDGDVVLGGATGYRAAIVRLDADTGEKLWGWPSLNTVERVGSVAAMASDAAGDIYLLGVGPPASIYRASPSFIARVDGESGATRWYTELADVDPGRKPDGESRPLLHSPISLDADGDVLVAGTVDGDLVVAKRSGESGADVCDGALAGRRVETGYGELSCALPPCGNGYVDRGEECDDGNAAVGDGCSDVCLVERACPPVDMRGRWSMRLGCQYLFTSVLLPAIELEIAQDCESGRLDVAVAASDACGTLSVPGIGVAELGCGLVSELGDGMVDGSRVRFPAEGVSSTHLELAPPLGLPVCTAWGIDSEQVFEGRIHESPIGYGRSVTGGASVGFRVLDASGVSCVPDLTQLTCRLDMTRIDDPVEDDPTREPPTDEEEPPSDEQDPSDDDDPADDEEPPDDTPIDPKPPGNDSHSADPPLVPEGCADADPCTHSISSAAGCRHVAPPAPAARVRCRMETGWRSTPCEGQVLPPRLERAMARIARLERDGRERPRAERVLSRTLRSLPRLLSRAARHGVAPTCVDAMAALDD